MLSNIPSQPADPILALMEAFRADQRPGKIDLGVGIWRDASGRTPVMRAVKAAEEQLWRTQDTKAYVGLVGDPAFHEAVAELLFGASYNRAHLSAAATTGGTSAVQTLLALAKEARQDTRVLIPRETWPNHVALADYLGLPVLEMPYYDIDRGAIDRGGYLSALGSSRAGDVVILHGACHNPSGADPDPALENEILATLERTGATPLVDVAYLGFGDTPERDMAFIRKLLRAVPEAMVAFSGSKSFGLYRDRVGLAFVQTASKAEQVKAQSTLAMLNRVHCSFPPDHGARVVTDILNDAGLREDWLSELAETRGLLSQARSALALALRDRLQSDRFDRLTTESGIFALLPLGVEGVTHLREAHGIYAVGAGRINFAGVVPDTVDRIADAFAEILA